jgi:hypothetical protein
MFTQGCAIIGAMKCGTTALFHTLAQHPQVSACKIKEPNYFGNPMVHTQSWDWYQTLYRWNPAAHKIALEASPSSSCAPFMPSAAFNFSRSKADWRFVYLIRNPIERIRSEYRHRVAMTVPPRLPIWEGIEPESLFRSNYHYQLQPYELIFSRRKLKVIPYAERKKICLGWRLL